MDIYQNHHKENASSLARLGLDANFLAEKVVEAELKKSKKPKDMESFTTEIAKTINMERSGEIMNILPFDMPETGLETDPICRACRECVMRDEDDVLDLYSRLREY